MSPRRKTDTEALIVRYFMTANVQEARTVYRVVGGILEGRRVPGEPARAADPAEPSKPRLRHAASPE